MARRPTLRLVGLTVTMLTAVVAGALVVPALAPAAETPTFRTDKFMALNTRGPNGGTAKNTSTDPMRTVFEFDVFSLATGEQIGTATDDIFCSTKTPPPCQVFDAVTTFHLPDGVITNHAQVSIVPDPQRPGSFLVGARPTTNSITKATGAYTGRQAKVRLTGWDDGSKYPNELGADDMWVFEFE